MHELKRWFQKYFDKAENILLLVLIAFSIFIIARYGRILAPFLVSLLLAYVLNNIAHFIVKKFKIRRMLTIVLLYLIFAGIIIAVVATLVPLISQQLTLLLQQIPTFIPRIQAYLQSLPDKYPSLISPEVINRLTDPANFKFDNGQLSGVLSRSLNSLSSLIEWIIYVFLVPIITFLLLKDKDILKKFYKKRFPVPQGIIVKVWNQVKLKLGGYIRGIFLEIIITAIAYSILLLICGLNYAVLLGIMSGVAVLIPVIGSLLIGIPVVIIGLFQFGLSIPFILMLSGYLIIHLLDAYLLAPYLFGKTLDLHPLAVLLALIFFGGLFGFWGLVFAVPLATFLDILSVAYLEYGDTKRKTVT